MISLTPRRGGGSDGAHGLRTEGRIGDELAAALRVCHRRGVEMLCCNPDYVATQVEAVRFPLDG